MGFFRPLHTKHYDSERFGGFSSSALDLRSGEPFSVVDSRCAVDTSGSICAHIERYYDEQTGKPKVYWPIHDSDIPSTCRIVPERTLNGDDCHRNIHGWGRNPARKAFKKLALEDLRVCVPEGERPATESDLKSEPSEPASEQPNS